MGSFAWRDGYVVAWLSTALTEHGILASRAMWGNMWMGARSNWTNNNKGGGTLKVNAMSRKILKLALTCLRLCAVQWLTFCLWCEMLQSKIG